MTACIRGSNHTKKTLGILAGLGPLAGAHFYRRLIELTPAAGDHDHLSVVLSAENSIPSRLDHLRGLGPSPVPKLIEVAQRLVTAKAEVLAIVSTTTHAYFDQIAQSISIPVLNLLELAADEIQRLPYRRVGIIATTPTCQLGLYDGPLRQRGITAVYPDAETQEGIMELIDAVKAQGVRLEFAYRLEEAMLKPWARDADAMILACTETPLVFAGIPKPDIRVPVFNATDILARAAISACWG